MVSGGGAAAPAASSPPVPQMTRKAFLAERNAKLALMEKQSEFLDKSLLTLAGGALGLTLTFLHDHSAKTIAGGWVVVGLIALVLCLLGVLFSVNFSQRSISKHIDALDTWASEGFPAGHRSEKVLDGSVWVTVTMWANRFATTALIVGLVCVSVFVALNLFQPDGGQMVIQGNSNSQSKPGGTPIERGAVIKPPPPPPAQSKNQDSKK